MEISRLQLSNLIYEALEGKEGEWSYNIVSIGDYSDKENLKPKDIKDVQVRVASGPSNVGYEFPLSEVETNEGTKAYEQHPLILQVIEAIKNNENLDNVIVKTANPIVDASGEVFLTGEGFMAISPKKLREAHPAISNDLAVYALSSFRQHHKSGKIKSKHKMMIVDYTIPGNKVRLWCLQVKNGKVKASIATPVAHGKGNRAKGSDSVTKFSNSPGTNAASVGAFVTTKTYYSKAGSPEKYPGGRPYKGISLRIDGLDKTNNNDLARGIVIHGAWYREKGKTGRSWGCLATSAETNKKIIDFAGIGTFGYKFGGRTNAASINTNWLSV
tara:strand:- start:1925 stop:2911 length:987 start_codon:yes stop_codon:yes gene_type:complete